MATGKGAAVAKQDDWKDYAPPVGDEGWQDAQQDSGSVPAKDTAARPGILDREIPLTSYGNATLSGLQSIGRGVRDTVTGMGTMIAHPVETMKNFGQLPSQAAQVPAAIHDINQSADPTGTYAKVGQETAGQGAGQALVALGTMALPKVLGMAKGTSVPARVLQTAGKGVENFDVTKPFKSIGKVGDYWHETSPEGRMLQATKQAVRERRASMIPLRTNVALPVDAAEIAKTEAMNRALRSNPSALAEASTPPAKLLDQASGLSQGPMAPSQASELQYRPQPVSESINMRQFEKSNPSALGTIKRPGRLGGMGAVSPDIEPTFVPEPRPEFPGEQPNYMASVPREELGGLAKTMKPGAAKQLQQLGKKIIYIPKGADYP